MMASLVMGGMMYFRAFRGYIGVAVTILAMRQMVSLCLVACGRRSLNVLILLLPGKLHKGLL